MENEKLLYFNHRFGFLLKDVLQNDNLRDIWVIAVVRPHEEDIVALIENKRFPFFGSQFHPEKVSQKNFKSNGHRFN